MTCVQNRDPLASAEVTPVTPTGSLTPKPQRGGRMGQGGHDRQRRGCGRRGTSALMGKLPCADTPRLWSPRSEASGLAPAPEPS